MVNGILELELDIDFKNMDLKGLVNNQAISLSLSKAMN
jgi:hypothetical protein